MLLAGRPPLNSWIACGSVVRRHHRPPRAEENPLVAASDARKSSARPAPLGGRRLTTGPGSADAGTAISLRHSVIFCAAVQGGILAYENSFRDTDRTSK